MPAPDWTYTDSPSSPYYDERYREDHVRTVNAREDHVRTVNARQERAEDVADTLLRTAAPELVEWLDDTQPLSTESVARLIAALAGSEHDHSYALRAIEDLRVRLVEDLAAADTDLCHWSPTLRRLMGNP